MFIATSHLDFDVDARSQRESHQGVDRLDEGLRMSTSRL